MKREEIIKAFKDHGINCDYNLDLHFGDANYIDDNFSDVLDLVEKLVSKNESLHLVSQCNAQDYARFCVECDRENLPMLCFSDWVKQYGG